LPLSHLPTSLEILNINEYVPVVGFFGRGRNTNNFVEGNRAVELTRLTNLTVLKMAQCGLEGDVPDAVLQLRTQDLRGNAGLTGKSLVVQLAANYTKWSSARIIDESHKGLTGALWYGLYRALRFLLVCADLHLGAQAKFLLFFCAGNLSITAPLS